MNALDLFLLALKGVLVASLPLVLVWAVRGGDRLWRLAVLTAFLTFDLIVFGGFTRLTDSGLGCPDWPGCYAKANPLLALTDIRNAEALLPDGPVTVFKAWIEMLHRYLAMGVGLLIVIMMVMSWWRARAPRALRQPTRPGLATALFVLVCLQGAFGAWTVTLKLQPVIVTMHLLLGMLLLAVLVWHALLLDTGQTVVPPAAALRPLVLGGTLLLVVQIALGGWVSTNYAVLACNDWPLCQGRIVPDMDFANGFHLWRELGRTADAAFLPFEALTAIHWTHRNFAWPVFIVLGWLAWRAGPIPGLTRPACWLGALLVLQAGTGIANILFSWPLLVAVLHNAGAAALVVVLVVLNYRVHAAARAATVPAVS